MNLKNFRNQHKTTLSFQDELRLYERALNISESEVIIGDVQISNPQQLLELIQKREQKIPLAYLFHEREFHGRLFYVDESVLIPREETEGLVNLAIQEKKEKILDLCTGSGIIAITMALETNQKVIASDISMDALYVAKRNAKELGANVSFIHCNLFENISDSFDLIISNPPYIVSAELNQLSDLECEPRIALDGSEDGLFFYREILKQAKMHLDDEGVILFEIGYDQANSLKHLAKEYEYSEVRVFKDVFNFDRYVRIVK